MSQSAKIDQWLSGKWHQAAAFQFLDPLVKDNITSYNSWPQVHDYQNIFPHAPINFIEQDDDDLKDCGGYERYIEKHKAIPTRPQNIHDFMNALSWHHFPNSKLSLHQTQSREHKQQLQSPLNKRSPLQNACTLFDEGGVILISESTKFIQAIRAHRWAELFLEQRPALKDETRLLVLGHALMEKSLNPYIGMCGNTIHIQADPQTTDSEIDKLLAAYIQKSLTNTKQLSPFPILGYPDWHPENETPAFYANTDYFRPL